MADTPPRGGTGGHPSGTGIIVGVDSLGGTRPPSPGSPSGGEGSHHTAASASVPGKGHGEEDVTTGSSVCRHIVATGRLAASGTAVAHPSGNPPSPPEGEGVRGRGGMRATADTPPARPNVLACGPVRPGRAGYRRSGIYRLESRISQPSWSHGAYSTGLPVRTPGDGRTCRDPVRSVTSHNSNTSPRSRATSPSAIPRR